MKSEERARHDIKQHNKKSKRENKLKTGLKERERVGVISFLASQVCQYLNFAYKECIVHSKNVYI